MANNARPVIVLALHQMIEGLLPPARHDFNFLARASSEFHGTVVAVMLANKFLIHK